MLVLTSWCFLALGVENVTPVGREAGNFFLGLGTKTRDASSTFTLFMW